MAAVTGMVSVAAVGGLTGAEAALLAGPPALATVAVLGCASVQARVSEKGLDVTFGPLGWPARRWTPGLRPRVDQPRIVAALVNTWAEAERLRR